MNNHNNIIQDNNVFLWLALGTGAILLVPLAAMLTTGQVNWDETDFIVMGVLLYGISSLFILIARKLQTTKSRIIAGIGLLLLFLLVWAVLAVGIFS